MARAIYVKAAQKNIYYCGKRVEYTSEKGKRKGQTLTKLDRTIPADENDRVYITKGEPYYWWAFLKGGKHYSRTEPRRSQLTQSSFLSQQYDLEDRIADFTCSNKDDFDAFKNEIQDEIENLKEETEGSLESMPDSLQSSPTGELLQERISGLESWHDEIDGIECEYDEDELKDEINSENENISDEDLQTSLNEKIAEIIDAAIDELKSTSSGL